MTLSLALARLDAFMEAHLGADDQTFDDAIRSAQDTLGPATVVLLRAICGGAATVPRGDLDGPSWAGVAGLILHASPEARTRVVEEVLFDVAAPPVYALLAPMIRGAFSGHELERALLFGLRSPDPRRRANARALPYYVMGRVGDAELTPLAHADVTAAGRADDPSFTLPLPAVPGRAAGDAGAR